MRGSAKRVRYARLRHHDVNTFLDLMLAVKHHIGLGESYTNKKSNSPMCKQLSEICEYSKGQPWELGPESEASFTVRRRRS